MIFARYRARKEVDQGSALVVLPSDALTPLAAATAAPTFSRLSLRQLEGFLMAASESLDAGITAQAFAQGAGSSMLPPPLASRLRETLASGGSLSSFLAEVGLPGGGDAQVLAAAERRGELPSALRALALGVEARRRSLSRFLGQLLYPTVLLLAWVLIEPLAKLVLGGPGVYLTAVLPRLLPLVVVALAVPYVVTRLHPRSRIRRWVVTPLTLVPPFAGILLYRARASFADVLSKSLRAGLPLYEALALAESGTTHPSFSRNLARVRAAVMAGTQLHVAAEALPFTREERAWIQNGEESGHLDSALERLTTRSLEQAQLRVQLVRVFGAVLFGVFVLARLLLGTVEAYRGYFKLIDGLLQPLLGTGAPRLE